MDLALWLSCAFAFFVSAACSLFSGRIFARSLFLSALYPGAAIQCRICIAGIFNIPEKALALLSFDGDPAMGRFHDGGYILRACSGIVSPG